MPPRVLAPLCAIVSVVWLSACVRLPESIVVTPPPEQEPAPTLFENCRRAAEDYCRDVVKAGDAERKPCISEATYECVSGTRD